MVDADSVALMRIGATLERIAAVLDRQEARAARHEERTARDEARTEELHAAQLRMVENHERTTAAQVEMAARQKEQAEKADAHRAVCEERYRQRVEAETTTWQKM